MDEQFILERISELEPIVGKFCFRYFCIHAYDECYQEASLALITVCRRYDPSKGIPFWGYALRRVWGAMLNMLKKQVWQTEEYNDNLIYHDINVDNMIDINRLSKNLTDRQRYIIRELYIEGRTLESIGDSIDRSHGLIINEARKAYKIFRECMSEEIDI